MAITLHSVASAKGARTHSKRLGRGAGSGRGKTSGKGTKGQRSRTGGKKSLKLKGMKQMLLSFPKNRGFKSRFTKDSAVRVARLSVLPEGSRVNLEVLRAANLISRSAKSAKILAGGELKKKLMVAADVFVTAGAKTEIERLGGSVASKA